MTVTTARELGEHIRDTRTRRGLTQEQLAEQLRVDRTVVNKIEAGSRKVTALELASIADSLGVRMATFFADPVPAVVSHRSSQGLDTTESQIDALLSTIADDVEFVQRLGVLPDINSPMAEWLRPESSTDAENMGHRIRELLGVPADTPVTGLSRLAAAIGLFVFSRPLGEDTADAGTVLLHDGGVCLVNSSQKVGRRRLATLHELCHFLVGDDYTVDWRVGVDGDRTEAWFDHAARAALLPRDYLMGHWPPLLEHEGLRTAAIQVTGEFQVDMATLARRLRDLDLVDAGTAGTVRTFRTTQADIIDLDLHPTDELGGESQPRTYQQAVLHLVRDERISRERGLELLWHLLTDEDLPAPAVRDEKSIWDYVS